MGVLGIVKGIKNIVEGVVEGDGSKIAKGIVKSGVGILTTITGKDSDDESDDDE